MNQLTINPILVAFLSLFILLTGCNGDKTKEAKQVTPKTETSAATKTVKVEEVSKTKQETKQETKNTKTTGDKMSVIKLETSKGDITIELDTEKAPLSAANFVSYVEDGFYDGLIFHRVIPGFMVQGGGMNPDMSEKPNKASIKNEANNGLKNKRGTLAMARTNDPHSATSQFFINLKDNGFLDHTSESPAGWGYAVFGKVTDGMDVVDAIEKVKTGNHGHHGDVPLEAVTIIKATVVK